MCLSNVYENSVEQKNLILSNVQRIDCKDGFVVLYDLFERETRVEGRLATIDLAGNTAVIVFAYALVALCVVAYFAFFRNRDTGTNADEKLSGDYPV